MSTTFLSFTHTGGRIGRIAWSNCDENSWGSVRWDRWWPHQRRNGESFTAMNYLDALDDSIPRLQSCSDIDDWNQQFRANLAACGLCLSVAHKHGAMADRYPIGGPLFAPRPWPGAKAVRSGPPPYPPAPDGWPEHTEVVWLDHPGVSPL